MRWWVIFSILCVGSYFAYNANVLQALVDGDKTCISFAIIGMFSLFTFLTGYCTFNICKYGCYKNLCKNVEWGWFFSEVFSGMGFIGTLYGFITVFKNFNTELSSQVVLAQMGSGMSIALYTTITGLICSILLKIQLFNISFDVDEWKENNE